MREMAEVLEDQLGLVHGWLLSVPCKVHFQDTGCILLEALAVLLHGHAGPMQLVCVVL